LDSDDAVFLIGSALVVLIFIFGCLLATGCKSYPVHASANAGEHIADANEQAAAVVDSLTRAEVRRETAKDAVERAEKASTETEVKVTLKPAGEQLGKQGDDLAEAKAANESLRNDLGRADRAAGIAAEKYEALRGEWYVTWGIWIERSLWTIGLSFIALNLIAFAGGIGSPVWWIGWLAKQIRLFMPGMNLSSWALAWWGKK